MTHDLRQRIRGAVDAHVRAHIQQFIDAGELQVCKGCGGDLECRTRGCGPCQDRHLKKLWRQQNPELCRERERARKRSRMPRERECAFCGRTFDKGSSARRYCHDCSPAGDGLRFQLRRQQRRERTT